MMKIDYWDYSIRIVGNATPDWHHVETDNNKDVQRLDSGLCSYSHTYESKSFSVWKGYFVHLSSFSSYFPDVF